ncbi:hypothetical protein BH23THE1_BH23THE1_11380 [soil metagenome]
MDVFIDNSYASAVFMVKVYNSLKKISPTDFPRWFNIYYALIRMISGKK